MSSSKNVVRKRIGGRQKSEEVAVVTAIRLTPDLRARIDAVLAPGESRSDFLRDAGLSELKRRERRPAKPKPPSDA